MSATSSRPDRRALWGPYAVGLFGMGYIDVFTFLIPLYALAVGLDPAEIGALVGARTVLALFFSIHVGTMMDRFGSVRVTQCCTVIAMVLAPVYPLVDGFWGLLILQIVVGGMVSFGWAGGQTMIAQLTAGDAEYIGRFSFASRIGTATAPLIAGAVWDFGGVWPAYLLCAVWGVVLMAALAFAPTWTDTRPQRRSRRAICCRAYPITFTHLR
jgi:MFS family permease